MLSLRRSRRPDPLVTDRPTQGTLPRENPRWTQSREMEEDLSWSATSIGHIDMDDDLTP